MKDFKNSYEQKSWEFRVAEYERMKEWAKRDYCASMVEYALDRIAQLEAQYPILKGT